MSIKKSISRTLVEGLIVGVVATEVLDWVSTAIYENESDELRRDEDETRHHMHAYEVAVKDMTQAVGIELDRDEIATWGWRFHKAFGYFGGVQYMMARNANPRVGSAMGLLFGTGFFLAVDEVMMPIMKWTPGPRAFSWKVHARGAAAHISYGVAAEATARLLDSFSSAPDQKANPAEREAA